MAYLPYTLPGEQIRVPALTRRGAGWAGTAELLTPSPARQPAPCPHFGTCGGCTLQHWQHADYSAWKTDQLRLALARAGFADATIGAPTHALPGQRRRIDLALKREASCVRVGLHRHRSAEIVDLQTCLVVEPRLVAMIAALRDTAAGLAGLRRTGSAIANVLDGGIDLLLRTDAALTAQDRVALSHLASRLGACRIAWALGGGPTETACQHAPATIVFAGAAVSPPPGAFLQASRPGEIAIVAAVLDGLPPPRTTRAMVVELFAGCGTLTFGLATRTRVIAYEGDAPSHAALRAAVHGRRIDARLRDLARQPLSAKEFAGADAIVLDPPFAGAAAQMPAIADSGVARVVTVSCNPAALARDARALHGAGYALVAATSIDQFLWSAAVESVCVFERPRPRRR